MLIVIRHPNGVQAGFGYAEQVAEHLDGKIRIYNPRSLEDFDSALKTYKPSLKQHLILLASHQDLGSETLPVEIQRQLEWALANKGGLVYGTRSPETLSTWVGDLEKDPAKLAKNAYVSTYRIVFARKAVGSKYTGRLASDPHTVLVGWAPNVRKISGIGRQIVSSLPVEWGVKNEHSEPSDWSGVGFISNTVTAEQLQKIQDWLQDTNFVALGEKAHALLEEAGIEHGSVPIPVKNGMFNRQITTPKYGWLIRDVAKSNANRLDWEP